MKNGEKPLIGVLGSTRKTTSSYGVSEFVSVGSTYIRAILKNGGIPAVIPAATILQEKEAALEGYDGFLFPGGDDITPSLYGEEPLPQIDIFCPELDESQMIAGEYALKNKKPMFGICKGIQMINVIMGGTIYQDLSLCGHPVIQHMQKYDRTYLTHSVQIDEGTILADILGAGSIMTNSMHHEAVKDLGEGLKATAHTSDGVIEAIESYDGLVLAVQWHPEELVNTVPKMNLLFKYFIDKCSA